MNTYIKNIEKDEIRSGYLVTTGRKKIWQKSIELLLEIDRICTKYKITYFVVYGTMLGCVRHKGFIPWDDDVDVAMLRSDYMRFVKVAAKEIKEPYFLQNVYSDSLVINWTKLRDSSTSSIEYWDNFDINQGIFVDIFPLDAVADGTERALIIDEMCKELWMSVISPQQIIDRINNGMVHHVSNKILEQILKKSLHERMGIYEDFCVKHFGDSSKVAFQMSYWFNRSKPVATKIFNKIEYRDFEKIKVPIPAKYNVFLAEIYGENWQTPIHEATPHEGMFQSVDIPYNVMLKNINRELLKCGDYLWKW